MKTTVSSSTDGGLLSNIEQIAVLIVHCLHLHLIVSIYILVLLSLRCLGAEEVAMETLSLSLSFRSGGGRYGDRRRDDRRRRSPSPYYRGGRGRSRSVFIIIIIIIIIIIMIQVSGVQEVPLPLQEAWGIQEPQ